MVMMLEDVSEVMHSFELRLLKRLRHQLFADAAVVAADDVVFADDAAVAADDAAAHCAAAVSDAVTRPSDRIGVCLAHELEWE
ncbi:unnamed protein product, partial [Lampetra planeri]